MRGTREACMTKEYYSYWSFSPVRHHLLARGGTGHWQCLEVPRWCWRSRTSSAYKAGEL